MKHVFLILFGLLLTTLGSKADTIDYWNVSLNRVKIAEFSQLSEKKEIILQSEQLRLSDSLTVRYFKDTPCDKCISSFIIKDKTGKILLITNGIGTLSPKSFALLNLIQATKNLEYGKFQVFYAESDYEKMIFTIQINKALNSNTNRLTNMSNEVIIILMGFGIPFLSFVIIFCWLVAFNKKTTGEIKQILPPDVFLKVMAVMMVVVVTFILTFYKIMEVSVTAAILGSVVTGTITSIKQQEK